MSVSKFRFVSPGIQIAEIDNSQQPRLPADIGPVIVGRANMGPALRPVQVNSFSEFVEIFGRPEPGGRGDDVWRNGTQGLAPTYGVYAAQAYLRNTPTVTFVRLLGAEHTNATTAGKAGWEVPNQGTTRNSHAGGAYGLFVMPTGSAGSTATGVLGAVFYLTTGSLLLKGADTQTAANTISGSRAMIATQNSNFKMEVRDGDNSLVETITFNFDRNSKNYIRKAFNTNPTLTNSSITPSDDTKTYWLGETFDREVADINLQAGVLLALRTSGSTDIKRAGKHKESLKKAVTPWIISQDLTKNSGSGGFEYQYEKLFRLKTHTGGDWEQKNLKISVSNVRASVNEDEPYGTFTVEIRSAKDSDNARKLLEQFTGCNLNPLSNNFIGRKIGDSFVTWSDTDRRYREMGTYPNQSKYVYVDTYREDGPTDAAFLPFGFEGPAKFKDSTYTSGSATDEVEKFTSGSVLLPSAFSSSVADGNTGGIYFGLGSGGHAITASLQFPEFTLRANSTEGQLASPQDAYFGVDTTRNGSTRFDESYMDLVRGITSDIASTDPTVVDSDIQKLSFIFTLEDLSEYTGSAAASGVVTYSTDAVSTTDVYYHSGSRKYGNSLSTTGSNSWNNVLKRGFDSFTLPLVGGFDGLDITEEDAFRNTLIDGKTELDNYAYNSIKRAIDSCKDPEIVEMDVMTVPGLTNTVLTDHVIQVCETRADALAIIDLEGGYIPPSEDNETDRSSAAYRGSADATGTGVIDLIENRDLNSSYGCAFYPWVHVRDGATGKLVWMPPSVAALGTFSSAQAKSELWFAPAGFTRGGLSLGAAGLSVLNVSEKLTSKQRDDLYEVNVNPIASFPAEGIVVYGQKTLQAIPSALDRINVRRLMIYVKKEISRIASTLLFDQNVDSTWARFRSQASIFLDGLIAGFGLTDYKLILDETTTTPDLVDRNIMYAKIFVKPARAIEFIALDFVITSTGASFDD